VLTEVGPFNESTVYRGDLDLWFRLAHHCDPLCWGHVGHSHRERPGSLTCGLRARSARDRITALQREKNRWSDRAALRQLDCLIAENRAAIGCD
jgi:hypothetical protein